MFNDTKCEVLRISRPKILFQHTYYLNDTPLKEVDHAKYLGIWFSKELKWSRHIDEITAETIQRRAARWCLRRYSNTFSVTNMLEDQTWRTLEQSRIDSRLTVLFKITRGLLSVKSDGLLRPVMRWTRRSHSERLQTSLSSECLS